MKKFSELSVGECSGIACLIAGIEELKAKNGSTFCKLTLVDGESQVTANYWQRTKADLEQWEKKVAWLEMKVEEYQGAKSYIIQGLHEAPEGITERDFVLSAPYPSEKMYDNIIQLLKENTGSLTDLALKLYEKNRDRMLNAAAAKAIHHAYYGGFLYHTLRMMADAKALSKVYKILDKELLMVSVALHDIGKLDELETDAMLGTAEYTVDGELFGHILMGVEAIDKELWQNEGAYDPERVKLLKHCIASHHGNQEWGAIKVPAIAEAQMLFLIDMIDSRMDIFEKEYQGMESGTISEKIFSLGTKIYKP